MAKKHIPSIAAALTAATAAFATPAAATPVFNIHCQLPGTDGIQRMEAYESAPGEMSVWYNLHAHIKVFEPLIRGTPIGADNVIRARIRPLGMDLHYHTVDNIGYATMTRDDFLRVFAPDRSGDRINQWSCGASVMSGKPRIIPFDPRGFTP